MTHTPGPWVVGGWNNVMGDESGGLQIWAGGKDEKTFALVLDSIDKSTLTANARLIAAAPSLLSALEDLTNDVAAGYDHRDIDLSEARAAIARAKMED